MKPVKVTCDSDSDLTLQLYHRYNIASIPLGIQLDDICRKEGVDVEPEDVRAYMRKTGKRPVPTAPTVAEYQAAFSEYIEQGFQIVHISSSSRLSAAWKNARAAALELVDVFVVDSRNLSCGEGHLAILGVELSHAGLSAAEVASALEDMKPRLATSFLLASPNYLQKSGLHTTFKLLRAKLSHAHPTVQMQHGQARIGKLFQEGWENAVMDYLRSQLENQTNIQHDRLFLTYAGIAPELLQKAVALIRELQPFDDIIVTDAGCVSCCQGGPCCLGIHYLRVSGPPRFDSKHWEKVV